MAQVTRVNQQSPICLAENGELQPGNQYRRSSPPTNRRGKRKAEPERIRALYAERRNGHEVARLLKLGHTTVYKYLDLDNQPRPRWTEEENQVLVDGYAEKQPIKKIAAKLGRRSPRAVMVAMCRYRKTVRKDEKKRYVLHMIGVALRALRKADIMRDVDGG